MIAAKNQTVFQQSVNTHIKVLHHVYACMPVIVAGCAHIVEVCIIYIYIYIYTHVYVYIDVYVYKHINMFIICVCLCICGSVYAFVGGWVWVCKS